MRGIDKNSKTVLKFVTYTFIFYLVMTFIEYILNFPYIDNEPIIRRLIHMFNRTSFISSKNFLSPFSVKIENIINKTDLYKLKKIEKTNKSDFPTLTRRNTSTLMYNDMNNNEQIVVSNIYLKVKEVIEKKINRKIYLRSKNLIRVYEYNGKNSVHDWHVDPNNRSNWVVVIILIDKKGNISPFQYKDKNYNNNSLFIKEGDGIVFKGGTTIHRIPKNNDKNSFRRVLGFSYSYVPIDKKKKENNLCAYLKGGKNYLGIIYIIFLIFILAFISDYIASIFVVNTKISNTYLLSLVLVTIIASSLIPRLVNMSIGTQRITSLKYNVILLISFMLCTISIRRGVLIYSYYLISELLYPSKLVFYY